MSGKSIIRIFGAVLASGVGPAASAFATDGPPTEAVPLPPMSSPRPLATTPGAPPLSRAMAPPGVQPIRLNVVQALQSRAHLPRSTPVPPTQEIEILDPNVDPTGKPAVLPVIGPDGAARVDIPPTVLVHRYYYTGDRSFQGPMLPGGPTVVVVNHPADGERLYLEVQLPPGAPRVIYTRHAIEYNYGAQSLILSFGAHGRPKVSYRQGVPLTAKAKVATVRAADYAARLVRRTGLPEAGRKVVQGAKNVVETSADRAHDVGEAVITPVVQIVRILPGVNLLTSPPDQRVQRERDVLVQQAQGETTRLGSDIFTNR